jgi:hypothetical protein
MPLFLHKFSGLCAAGDQFSYQWYANSIRDIDTAHAAAIVWNQVLWNGATAGNGYKDHVTADVSMAAVITAEINVATGLQSFRRETGQVIAGAAGGNAMPADVALCVSLRSALANRSGRGRFYLPQPAAGSLTSTGRASADLVNDLIAALGLAWAGYNTGVDRPTIYSRTFRVMRNLVSFDVGDLFDTQRRRENKVTQVRVSAAMP